MEKKEMSYFNKLIFCVLFGFAIGFAVDARAADIQLGWDHATEREDNSALSLSEIDGYRIYYSVDSGSEQVIALPVTTSHTLSDVAGGSYTFQISTVSEGVEGYRSDPIIVPVAKAGAKYPIMRVIIERCDFEGNCVQEVVQ